MRKYIRPVLNSLLYSNSRIATATALVGYTLSVLTPALPLDAETARASAATYYDASTILQSSPADTERYTYEPNTGAFMGLLLEPASTNTIRNNTGSGATVAPNALTAPTDLTNAGWTKGNVTIVANSALDSTGASTLDKIAETTATGEHYVTNIACVSGRSYYLVFEARAAEQSQLVFDGGGFTAQGLVARWNLADGTVADNTGSQAFIENLGGGLYRCSVYFTATTTANFRINIYDTATNSINYTGVAGNGLYVGQFKAFANTSPGASPTNWGNTVIPTGIQTYVYATGTTSTGLEYVDRLIVGSTAAIASLAYRFESNTNTAAANGETWSASIHHQLQLGSLNGVTSFDLLMNEYATGGVLVTTQSYLNILQPTPAVLRAQRQGFTATLNGGATTATVNMQHRLNFAANTPVMLVLRQSLPQLEKLNAVSTIIKTSGATVTRAAETLSVLYMGAKGFTNGHIYPVKITHYDNSITNTSVTVTGDVATIGPIGTKPITSIAIGSVTTVEENLNLSSPAGNNFIMFMMLMEDL